jgi:hypothetical protein
MTRSSFQEGYVCSRATERGTVHVIRYRVTSAAGLKPKSLLSPYVLVMTATQRWSARAGRARLLGLAMIDTAPHSKPFEGERG